MWMSGSGFKRFTDVYNTIRWTNNIVCRINTFNITSTGTDRITTYRMITDVLTVTYSNRRTGNEHACDGPDVTKQEA